MRPREAGSLPLGWTRLDDAAADGVNAELRRELAPQHPLSRVPLGAVAARNANDDTLFRRLDLPDRFLVIHLTWSGHAEPPPLYPSLDFAGTFSEFIAWWEKESEWL